MHFKFNPIMSHTLSANFAELFCRNELRYECELTVQILTKTILRFNKSQILSLIFAFFYKIYVL